MLCTIMLSRFNNFFRPRYKKLVNCPSQATHHYFSKMQSNTKICTKTNTTQEQGTRNSRQKICLPNIVIGLLIGGISYKTLLTYSDCEEKTLPKMNRKLEQAIERCRDTVQQIKDEIGSPGIVIGVSVDGQEVWSEGFGYADVENRVPCTSDAVMRIASISKPITMTIVARLMEEGKLDIDKPVQVYVPNFPRKTFGDKQVTITTRQLLCHMSGIRHYNKDYMETKGKKKANENTKESDTKNVATTEKKELQTDKEKRSEFYLTEHYNSISDSLKLFKDDPLMTEPGTKYQYTTHGWTLISAVLEGATGKSFDKLMRSLLKDLGMEHCFMEEHEPLIYNRARYYIKNKRGRLVNAPYVDLSYKWAGGGLISTVGDIVKFGNIILYSLQAHPETNSTIGNPGQQGHMMKSNIDRMEGSETTLSDSDKITKNKSNTKIQAAENRLLPGYLRPETVSAIWEPVNQTGPDGDPDGRFALGWAIVTEKREKEFCEHRRFYAAHTGGSMGASSVLIVLPRQTKELQGKGRPPDGVVVAMMANINRANLNQVAIKIAKIFEETDL